MFETLLIAAMTVGASAGPQAAAGPTCHANGLVFDQGQIVCLDIPCAPQLARCGMVLNNSAWIKIQDGCVVADVLDRPGPTRRANAEAMRGPMRHQK